MSSSHPEKIGKYSIITPLGRGAMGMVYEGYDSAIDRTVAIKVIRKNEFTDDEQQEALDRFKREAQAAGKLSHANIVMVYEYGEEEDIAYIAMEYVKGQTLHEIITDNSLTIKQIRNFMVQLLDGLDYAHTHHVTHRDIKPANLVYTNEGQIKIMDFGIARVESSTLTQVGTIMGTPAYMAPELFTGEKVDHRTDLFSAAVILYQLLTGQKPFTGSTMSVIMHQVINIQPANPSEINRKLPKALDQLLRQALSKKSGNRFQSAVEFKKGLLQAFKKIAPDTKIPRQTTGTAFDQTIINTKTAPPLSPRSYLTPRYLIGLTLLLIGLVTSLFFFFDRENIAEPRQPIQTAETINPEKTETTAPPQKKHIKTIYPQTTKKKKIHISSPVQQQKQPNTISINGRQKNSSKNYSGNGIRITTPRSD
jgi:serine/threonine-protein kinase